MFEFCVFLNDLRHIKAQSPSEDPHRPGSCTLDNKSPISIVSYRLNFDKHEVF
jgi:hypothetical protein